MPLPLIPAILGGAAVATAALGASMAHDAYKDSQTAKGYHERARRKYKDTADDLNEKREKAELSFTRFGRLKEEIVNGNLAIYASIIDKLHLENDTSLEGILGKETLGEIKAVQDSIISLQTILGGLVGGAAAGAMAGFGAFGAAGLLASASTGTAIASLSGAAATKATLAWFSGGSLASGLGMAGGTYVLGGIVAAPVILVAAAVWATNAEKKKYDAQAYYDSVRALCEAMEAEGLGWRQITRRAREQRKSCEEINEDFAKQLDKVEVIINEFGDKVNKWGQEQQDSLRELVQIAEALVVIISAPLMGDSDDTTQELRKHEEKCRKLMEEIQTKWGA